jgi:hypothetical protein
MRSKWLDWTTGFVGFVGSSPGGSRIICRSATRIIGISSESDPTKPTKPLISTKGRDLEIARRAPKGSQGALSYERNEINGKRVTDPYQELVRATLAKVSDQPVGMIPRLRQNRPMLYEKLAVQLPDHIHRLWEGRAPLVEFERILQFVARNETSRNLCGTRSVRWSTRGKGIAVFATVRRFRISAVCSTRANEPGAESLEDGYGQ